MAEVFNSLLTSVGGGVINNGQKSKRQPGATVIIGLGGTGKDAVIKIKKELYQQIQPDDPDAVIPRYDTVRFLVVDSDDDKIKHSDVRPWDIDRHTEYFSVSNDHIVQTLQNVEILKSRRELDWMNYEDIKIADASHGAGGIRQIGRFLLVDKASEFVSKLTQVIRSAQTASTQLGEDGGVNIHILSGISGGTGAGTFLDACYLLRKVLYDNNILAQVCGYFFLPDVNLSAPGMTENVAKYVRENGYASLKELDYCMSFGANRDYFKMNYGAAGIIDETIGRTTPVDLCYLISSTNTDGRPIPNGYRYAMGVASDFIMSFLALVQLPANVKAGNDDGLTLEGHIANLNRANGVTSRQHGSELNYNILGASIGRMPLSEIMTYLGAKLFESYGSLKDRVPTETDRNNFLSQFQLEYRRILQDFTRGCATEVVFPPTLDADEYKRNNNRAFVRMADDVIARNRGILETNLQAFSAELGDTYAIPENPTSLIARTFKKLCEACVAELNYGPYYAERMLAGEANPNIINAVDGMIRENESLRLREERQRELREQDLQKAENALRNSNVFNAKTRVAEYRNALSNWYMFLYNVEKHVKMDILLRAWRDQLVDLHQNFFRTLSIVMATMQETFKRDIVNLTEGDENTDEYDWKILSVKDIFEDLDAVVAKMNIEQSMKALMSELLGQYKTWINSDEDQIARLISNYITDSFRETAQKTIEDYLEIKFNTTNPTVLAQRVQEDILERQLNYKAKPLFWRSPSFTQTITEKSTVTVPFNVQSIVTAAENFAKNNSTMIVRKSGIQDRISLMHFHSGLPLFAYNGMFTLQEEYLRNREPGRHLYERGVNWYEFLPDPIPTSFQTARPVEQLKKRSDEITDIFTRAEALGVVKDKGSNAWVISTTSESLDSIMASLAPFEKGGVISAANADDAVEALKAAMDKAIAGANEISISNGKALPGAERNVTLDYFIKSPVEVAMVKTEVEKREAVAAKIASIEGSKGEILTQKKARREFFRAVFTGVIKWGGMEVSYENEDSGRTVILAGEDMAEGEQGIYCAWKTFQKMAAEESKDYKHLTADVKSALGDEDAVGEVLTKLTEQIPKRCKSLLMKMEDTAEYAEIEEFLNELKKEFDAFKLDF